MVTFSSKFFLGRYDVDMANTVEKDQEATVSTETCVARAAATNPEATDQLVSTKHRLQSTEGELCYTAKTGRIVLHEDEYKDDVFEGRKAKAEIAITEYILDNADVLARPVTFVFNGGPGSASLWLHLGLVGPRIVDCGDAGSETAPPFGLRDNPETLLRATDLVIIDPISTGHSRAVTGAKAKEYHGFKKDVEQLSELIRLWVTRNNRWLSPKYLCGESYGTTRGVAIAERLHNQFGMALNGIILISSVLDFGTQDFRIKRWDESCIGFLPTYAATAWYHGKTQADSVEELVREVEEFAQTRYRLALAKGNELPESERDAVATEIARYCGLSKDYVLAWNLRIEHWRFCGELLRDAGLTVGRIDSRFTGPKAVLAAENMDSDPSTDRITGAFAAAMQYYHRAELKNELDFPYHIFSGAIEHWDYSEFTGKPINVTGEFERVMRANKDLRVRVEYGLFDLATPWGAARDTFRHLNLNAEALARIEHRTFPTGHMPYVHEESRRAEANEIVDFIRRSSNR